MKLLVLGNKEMLPLLRNAGHLISSDPDDKIDAVVCSSVTYRLAPDGVPLFILMSGGPSDWAVRKDRPDAHFYTDQQQLVSELVAAVCETGSNDLPPQPKDSLLVASYGNKGGVGKSTSAISIATMVAKQGASTVLFDLDYGGANIATFFNINKHFDNYLTDQKLLRSSLFKVKDNLYILPSPSGIVPNQITTAQVFQTSQTLKEIFQVVVCDTPPSPWDKPYIHTIFANANIVYAIVNQSKFSMEEAVIYGPQLIAMGTDIERVRIILNDYNPKLVSPQKVEEAFNKSFHKTAKKLPKIQAIIPHNYEEHIKALQKGTVINEGIWTKVTQEIIMNISGNLKSQDVMGLDNRTGFMGNIKRRWKK